MLDPRFGPETLLTYYFEYRREVGFDRWTGIHGVTVRLVFHSLYPGWDGFTFALPDPLVLVPGRRFEDTENTNLSIEVISMTDEHATLLISHP